MIKKILVLHTGGTISMSADDDGKVSQNADNPMNHVGLDLDNLALTVLDLSLIHIFGPRYREFQKVDPDWSEQWPFPIYHRSFLMTNHPSHAQRLGVNKSRGVEHPDG